MIEYAQARLQARYGERADEALWQQLAVTKELGPLLETAHRSPLRRWVAGIDAGATLHDIELNLRARLRDHVSEVATWMPAPWRAAIAWTGTLADLPALLHLARGGAPLAWMAKDAPLAPWVNLDDETRAKRLRAGPLAFVAPLWDLLQAAASIRDERLRTAVLRAWRDAWRRLWPSQSADGEAALSQLEHALVRHVNAFGALAPDRTADARREVARRMAVMFRRAAQLPAVAFAYLAIVALDLERLRAELVRRVAPEAEAFAR
jgi:hypothetical protein